MKRYSFFLLLLVLLPSVAHSQPVQQKLIVPLQFQTIIDTNKTVMLPAEYEISVFYAGILKRPRFMALSPKNMICVADIDGHQIVALPDANRDGIADTAVVIAPEVDTAHSLAFYNGDLYVAQPSRVRKFIDKNGDGFYESEEPFITGIGDTGYYNHFTRTIVFDTIGKHIYLSVGASCNACREGDPERGTILQFNLDGSGRRIFATGLRNALGLAINPEDGRLWATNADRDGLGDEIPPEIITPVYDSTFYGWPFAYRNQEWENFQAGSEYKSMLPILSGDSARVHSMQNRDDRHVYIGAHMTPMGILFYHDPRIAPKNQNQVFFAVHGSSSNGRPVARGYEVMRIVYNDSLEVYRAEDFLTGFLTDSINYKYWGRPCGIVQDTSGDIFLSCDLGIPAIYRIHLRDQIAVKPVMQEKAWLAVYPNPITSSATISFSLPSHQYVRLELIDQLGRVIQLLRSENEDAGSKNVAFQTGGLPGGMYYLRLQDDNGMLSQKVIITK
ncbi:MAG: T9SS type A sorting domain-containing protein [Candidatus Kapaibacterium sp.]